MLVTKSQLVKRFNAILRHACDMEPLMVLEFVRDCEEALNEIEFCALQDIAGEEVDNAPRSE